MAGGRGRRCRAVEWAVVLGGKNREECSVKTGIRGGWQSRPSIAEEWHRRSDLLEPRPNSATAHRPRACCGLRPATRGRQAHHVSRIAGRGRGRTTFDVLLRAGLAIRVLPRRNDTPSHCRASGSGNATGRFSNSTGSDQCGTRHAQRTAVHLRHNTTWEATGARGARGDDVGQTAELAAHSTAGRTRPIGLASHVLAYGSTLASGLHMRRTLHLTRVSNDRQASLLSPGSSCQWPQSLRHCHPLGEA